jgi:hypothetical protein
MADWLPDSEPDWFSVVTRFSGELKDFLRDPRGYIWGTIATLIISVVLNLTRWAGRFLQDLFSPFFAIARTVINAIETAVSPLAVIVEGGATAYLVFVRNLALATGPLAPFAVLAIHSVVVYVVFVGLGRLARAAGLGSFFEQFTSGGSA